MRSFGIIAGGQQEISDDGIDGFGVFFNTPDNMHRKAIIIQVTGASGSQKVKKEKSPMEHNCRCNNGRNSSDISLTLEQNE